MVAEEGVGALTIRRVADAAGLVPGSLRYVFESQEALADAIAEELVSQVRSAIAANAARHFPPGVDAAAMRLLGLVALAPDAVRRWQVEHALYIGLRQRKSFALAITESRNARGAECFALVQEMQVGLDVSDSEVHAEVLHALALVEGLSHVIAHGNHGGDDAISPAEAQIIVRRHVRAVRESWRRRPPR